MCVRFCNKIHRATVYCTWRDGKLNLTILVLFSLECLSIFRNPSRWPLKRSDNVAWLISSGSIILQIIFCRLCFSLSLSLSLSLFRVLLFYTCNVSSSCSESTLLFAIQNIYLIFFSRAHELITRRRKYCSTSGTSIFSHIRSSDSREIFETRKSFGIFGSDKISIASLRRLFLVHCVLVTGFDVYSVFMQITRLACK